MYTIHELAALAGVSTRTLRYYHQLGLLPPAAVADNGYRLYGPEQAAALQQILCFRDMGLELRDIPPLLHASPARRAAALEQRLAEVRAEQQRLQTLETTLQHTILELKGEYTMTDKERFEGLKRQAVADNEQRYGAEVRQKYGDAVADAANARLLAQTEEQWQDTAALEKEILERLTALAPAADPAGEEGRRLAALHGEWLRRHWPEGLYSPEMHLQMAQMYRADERFAAYYDKAVDGGCEFLCRAIEALCQ